MTAPISVTLTDDDMPDAWATKHTDGSYEFAITGLTGLTVYQENVVVRDSNGDTVQATDAAGNPLWKTDHTGQQILNDDGNPIPIPLMRPNRPRFELVEAGITSLSPPTIRTKNLRMVERLMLRAVEERLPAGLLDNVQGVPGALDKEQLLLVQLTRVWRRLLWKLEPPV